MVLSFWWGWTVLIDFVIVKTIFTTIHHFFQAGDLGTALFLKLNNLEIISSTFLLTILFFEFRHNRRLTLLLIISLAVWMIPMIYIGLLTPKLKYLNELWKESDSLGVIGLNGIPDVQQEHQFFHRIYIALDSLKLIFLTSMLFLGISKRNEWT